MLATRGYATTAADATLGPFQFERRHPGPDDVLIEILYCGVCHSDIHQARETQEMLDFCAEHKIASDVEVIPIQDIEHAYERTIKGDVRYRFVIDMKTL